MKAGFNIRQSILAGACEALLSKGRASSSGEGDLGQFAFQRPDSAVGNSGEAPQPHGLDGDNLRLERRGANTEGAYVDAVGRNRMEQELLRNNLAAMSKAVLIVARKNIKTERPDEEVGEDDLPKGTLKYDEVPDVNAQNMVGVGGAGRAECTVPMSMGGGMLPNFVMGAEILRASVDALNRAKDGEGKRGKEDPALHTPKPRNLKLA